MPVVSLTIPPIKSLEDFTALGVSVVNALSEYLEVEIRRDGKVYKQRYERGITATALRLTGETGRPAHESPSNQTAKYSPIPN